MDRQTNKHEETVHALLDSEKEGITIIRNVGNDSSISEDINISKAVDRDNFILRFRFALAEGAGSVTTFGPDMIKDTPE